MSDLTRTITLELRADRDGDGQLCGVEVVAFERTLAWWKPATGLKHEPSDWPLLLGELGALCCSAYVQLQAAEADGEPTK